MKNFVHYSELNTALSICYIVNTNQGEYSFSGVLSYKSWQFAVYSRDLLQDSGEILKNTARRSEV